MNYLTNYYKNLCEQRQEQIQILEQQLIQEGIMDTIKGVADKVDSVVGGKLSRTFGKVASSVGDFLSSAGKEASAIGRSRHLPTLAADSHRRAILGHFDYPKSWEEFGKEAESMMSELQVRRRANLPTVDDVYRALPKKSFDKKTGRMEDYAGYDAMKEKLTQKAIAEERKHEQSMVLGRLASKISAVSAADIAERKQYEKDHGTGSRYSHNRSEGVSQHHGGHSWHRDSVHETSIPHPEAQSYLDWFNETGRHHEGVPHPDALFGDRSTFHVAEEFEHLLNPQYQKANRKNRAKFDEVVKQAQTIRERIDIPQKAAQDREDLGVALSGGMPSGLRMESKKQLLNNKIKYLLENEKDEGDPTWGDEDDDVDFGDNDSVDLDAPDEEDVADLNSIRNVEYMIDKGLERIWSASDHPRATDDHKKRLSDIDDRLSGYADGLKFSKHPDDVAGYHQDVQDALDELEGIHDELGPHDDEDLKEFKIFNSTSYVSDKVKNLLESEYDKFLSKSDFAKSKYAEQSAKTKTNPTPMPKSRQEEREEARVSERAKKFPDLGAGFKSWDEFDSAVKQWDEKSGKPHPGEMNFDHEKMTADNIHLATSHELDRAEHDINLTLDGISVDPGEEEPDWAKSHRAKLDLISKQRSKLQESLNNLEMELTEAGLKTAMRTKDPERLKKAKAAAMARSQRYADEAAEEDVMGKIGEHGASSNEAAKALTRALSKFAQADRVDQNISEIEKMQRAKTTGSQQY